jgi:hypothetical protein
MYFGSAIQIRRGGGPGARGCWWAELRRMHATGNYTITDLAELISISRPIVYRTIAAVEAVPAQPSRR